MRPSLIIGIGGTGMVVGHYLKYFIHTYMSEDLRNYFKFVFIDNDKNQFSDSRTSGISKFGDFSNEIVKISDFNAYEISKLLKAKENKNDSLPKIYNDLYGWYDTKVQVKTTIYEEGLAAYRMVGRSCGYVNRNAKIQPAISYATNELKSLVGKLGKKLDDKAFNVYIITSNSGGTGSSLFFDISLMIDIELNTKSRQIPKTLILVGPNYYLEQKKAKKHLESDSEYQNLQINSWAFIDECEFFVKQFDNNNSLMGNYYCAPSDIKNKISDDIILAPFTSAIIFDNKTSLDNRIDDNKFFNAIAEVLFYTLSSSSNDKFISEVTTNSFIQVDETTGAKKTDLNQYLTLGIKVIRFPKEEYSKYFKVRYVYEVFKKFLDKNPNEKIIRKTAEDFINSAFSDEKSLIVTEAIDIFKGKIKDDPYASEKFLNEYLIHNPVSLFRESESQKFKNEEKLRGLFNENLKLIEKIKQSIEEIYNKLKQTDELFSGFYERYNTRNTFADKLRRLLWQKAYEILAETGYYGLVGIEENTLKIKGFIDVVREKLAEVYKNYTNEYMKIHPELTKIKNEIEQVGNLILKKSKGHFGAKNVKKEAEEEIKNYASKLGDYRDKLVKLYSSKIQQEILYHFALGDIEGELLKGSAFEYQLRTASELTRYEKGIKERIGTLVYSDNPNALNLINFFDDNKNESSTIKNEYQKKLPLMFTETTKDYFTKYLPYDPTKLLDHKSDDGWKKGNELGNMYKPIVINRNELDLIFKVKDLEDTKYRLATLSDPSNDNISTKSIINEIKATIENYCKVKYLENSESKIGQFLNKTIQDVINELTEEEINNLIQDVREIEYPVNAPNLSSIQAIGLYFNVHSNLSQFVLNTFKPQNKNDVVTNDKMEQNKIVAVLYKKGLAYGELTNHSVHFQAYKDRNKNVYRPFLNKKWNEYTRGPWEDPKLKKSVGEQRIMMKIDRKTKDITYREVIAFCISIDILLQKSSDLVKKIFVADKKIIEKDGLINRSIIHYDENLKKFVYAKEAKYDSNKKLRIREGLNKDNFVELDLSLDINKFIDETETERNYLKFINSAQNIAKDEKFNDSALKNFCIALSNYKEDIKKALNKNINSISTTFRNLAVELKNRNLDDVKIEESDYSFADEFDETMRRLLKDFFGIK